MPGEIIRLAFCDSTNDRMKDYLREGKKPFAVISRSQTSGRGRTGKKFFSESEKGLYVSFYFETAEKEKLTFITPMTSVAVMRALEKNTGVSFSVKWVNDIFISGKKVAGILTEKTENGVVIGIGINLDHTPIDFPEDIRNIATSVFIATGKMVDREALLSDLVSEMRSLFSVFPDDEKYREEYVSKNIVPGKEISFFRDGETLSGKCLRIMPDYSLEVGTKKGTLFLSGSEITVGSQNFENVK